MKQLKDTVFMVMSFGDELANTAYNHVIKPVLESFDLRIVRADEIFSTNPIFDDIVTAIQQAVIVIVDISGRNANCFYELGMSHTLKQSRTIMITHDDIDKAPFDIAHFRIIRYEDSIKGRERYEHDLRKTVSSILTGVVELYHREFSLVSTALEHSHSRHVLYLALALSKSNKPKQLGKPVEVEGNLRGDSLFYEDPRGNQDTAQSLLELGYCVEVDGNLSLTERGQSFAGFLASQGYVVDYCDGEIFTEGYEPYKVKWARKLEDLDTGDGQLHI